MPGVNCAVYVRKSTERGLEQEFNSLDNQEAACRAYIASQAFNNWEYFKTYSDGGISGGTMDRPGLQEMLDDIKAGKIAIVLVYKIDRLSRSIMDFHNMMQLFDKYHCNFVSITQAFDTSSSMGKLTLNMLLSFAQFEREVASERVRDKIRASRAKGIWTGGFPVLGYNIVNKKLVVNEPEAAQVRMIFELYQELDSVAALMTELRARGITSKKWITAKGNSHGGQQLSYIFLHKLLRNKIYIGILEHKINGTSAKGEHPAIISDELFNAVQEQLCKNGNTHTEPMVPSPNILSGKLYTADGVKFINACTRSKRHHDVFTNYYAANKNYIRHTDIDTVTIATIDEFMNASLVALPVDTARKLKQIDYANMNYATRNNFIKTIVDKAVITNNKLTLFIKADSGEISKFIVNEFVNKTSNPMAFMVNGDTVIIEHTVVFNKGKQLTRYNTGHKGLMTITENNHMIIHAFATAHKYRAMYERDGDFQEIVKSEQTSYRNVYRYLSLAYLSPATVNKVMSGKTPTSLNELFKLNNT